MLGDYVSWTIIGSVVLAGVFVLYFKLKNKALKTETKVDDRIVDTLVGLPAVIIDWKVNWLISPLFWELPKGNRELVTHRMARYKDYSFKVVAEGSWLIRWRWWFANRLCRWLSKYDPGHCDKYKRH